MEVYTYLNGDGDGKMTAKKTEEPRLEDPSIKTKVSVSIIGDAFADLLCYLDNGLPKIGGDVRVNKPSKYAVDRPKVCMLYFEGVCCNLPRNCQSLKEFCCCII